MTKSLFYLPFEETQAQQPRDLDDKGVPLPPISDDRKYGQTTPSRGTRVPPRADRATPGAPPPAALLQDRVADSERRAPGMPNCPIVLVMGKCCHKSTHCDPEF